MPRRRKETADPNILEKSSLDKQETLNDLKNLIAEVFLDAQKPEALLRVDAIKLRDIQLASCLNSPRLIGQQEEIDYEGETRFLSLTFKMVNVVIRAKKKEPTADRVQRFIAGFIQYIQSKDEEAFAKAKEKKEAMLKELELNKESNADEPMEDVDNENKENTAINGEDEEANNEDEQQEQESDDRGTPEVDVANTQDATIDFINEDYETLTSRFVESFLKHLFQGFQDSKASVRFRCCQLIALSLSSMGELDEDLYQELRTHLLEAYVDKEPSVRAQACTALCRLQGDPEVDPSDNKSILEKLMWSVRYDPSPEVRRLILFNIEVTIDALPFIVKCIRDPDNVNRKVVYLKALSHLEDFRILNSEQKYEVLKWGLNDRNELVQKVAYRMFSEKWIEHAKSNLLEFMERLESTRPMMAPLVEKLLNLLLKDRNDLMNEIKFDEDYWLNLTGESSLLAKVVILLLLKTDESDERIDSILPVLTKHVSNLENYFGLYLEAQDEASKYKFQFIITQLLDISLSLDYADEVGRRRMFDLLRNVLKSHVLSAAHLERVLKLFRIISIDERDYTRSIIEIISDIQEEVSDPFIEVDDNSPAKRAKTNNGDRRSPDAVEIPALQSSQEQPTQSETAKEAEQREAKIRCLNICKFMLENSYESLAENSNLCGLLNDLISPAVHSPYTEVREVGVHCLALSCMLDKRLTQHNFKVFLSCIQAGFDDHVKVAIQSISDLLLMYGMESLVDHIRSPELVRQVYEFGLDHDDTEVQAVTTQGLCKVMLFNRYGDEELLRLLVLLYFFPQQAKDEFRNNTHQCLAYFFPAYCYSSVEHQKALANITLPALQELCNVYDDLDTGETMTSPKQISDILADWNDPRKLVMKTTKIPTFVDDKEEIDYETQGTLAIDTLNLIYIEEDGLTRRTVCHFLLRLYLDKISKEQMLKIKDLINLINEKRPIKLIPLRKAITKIADKFEKILESQDEIDEPVETESRSEDQAQEMDEDQPREEEEEEEQEVSREQSKEEDDQEEMEEVQSKEDDDQEREIEEVQSKDGESQEQEMEKDQSSIEEDQSIVEEDQSKDDEGRSEVKEIDVDADQSNPFDEQNDDQYVDEEEESTSEYEDAEDEVGGVDYSDRPAEVYVRIDGIVDESIDI